MKKNIVCLFVLLLVWCSPERGVADVFDYSQIEKSFENFMRCELTRTDAVNHFKGKPFKITMVDMFDIQYESDLKIITGAVECFVEDKHLTLFAAVGLKTILETDQVLYYTVRKQDFSILATELFRFPYKERCQWTPYWIDID